MNSEFQGFEADWMDAMADIWQEQQDALREANEAEAEAEAEEAK